MNRAWKTLRAPRGPRQLCARDATLFVMKDCVSCSGYFDVRGAEFSFISVRQREWGLVRVDFNVYHLGYSR